MFLNFVKLDALPSRVVTTISSLSKSDVLGSLYVIRYSALTIYFGKVASSMLKIGPPLLPAITLMESVFLAWKYCPLNCIIALINNPYEPASWLVFDSIVIFLFKASYLRNFGKALPSKDVIWYLIYTEESKLQLYLFWNQSN